MATKKKTKPATPAATPKEKKEDVLTKILSLRDEALEGFSKHKKDFQNLENGFMSIIDEGKRTSLRIRRKSSLTPMLIKPKVDSLTRDVLRSFFGAGTLADIEPESASDAHDISVSECLKKELKAYERESKIYGKAKATIVRTFAYGTAALKVYFSTKDNTVKIEACKLNEVYYDRKAASPDDIKYIVHRVDSMTIGELKEAYPNADVNWSGYIGNNRDGVNTDDTSSSIGEYQRPELFEVYRLVGSSWHVTTLLDDTALRQDVELKDGNPFITSFIEQQFVLIDEAPVRAYGSPLIAPLLPIQTEYVIRRNQQIDAIDLQLNQRFLTTTDSGLRDQDLNSTRKKLVVNSLDSVKELQAPRIESSIFDTKQLEEEAEYIFGVSKYSQGMSSEQNKSKTKGEAMILDARGSSVTDDVNRSFNENLFRPLLSRIIMLLYKYKSSSNFAGLDRTKPLRQKVIINVGTGSANTEVKLQRIDSAMESAMGLVDRLLAMGDTQRAAMYLEALDKLQVERFKLLGHATIAEELDNDINNTGV